MDENESGKQVLEKREYFKSEESKKRALANLELGKATRFKKGESGRVPKSIKINDLARKIRARTRNGTELLDVLLDIVGDKKCRPKDRIDAIKILIERGWGRVPMEIEVGGKDGGPIKIEHSKKEVLEKIIVLMKSGALPGDTSRMLNADTDKGGITQPVLDIEREEVSE